MTLDQVYTGRNISGIRLTGKCNWSQTLLHLTFTYFLGHGLEVLYFLTASLYFPQHLCRCDDSQVFLHSDFSFKRISAALEEMRRTEEERKRMFTMKHKLEKQLAAREVPQGAYCYIVNSIDVTAL